MDSKDMQVLDVVVIGAGPAGVLAAIRAADLGARTALVSSAEFGGMVANDGPVPVRTLAYAARLAAGRAPLASIRHHRRRARACSTTSCSLACARSSATSARTRRCASGSTRSA